MKMHTKEFQMLLDEESDDFDAILDKQQVSEKINKLLVKEKHADMSIYRTQDSKRKFKSR